MGALIVFIILLTIVGVVQRQRHYDDLVIRPKPTDLDGRR